MSRLDTFHDAVRRHGSPEAALDHVFSGNPRTSTPYPPAGYLKTDKTGPGLQAHTEAVHKALSQPPELQDVDHALLHSTQPSIIRSAAQHYLTGRQWEQTGETYADKGNVGNQYPVVYRRARDDQHQLLSGHHRATAALMRGEPLRARVIQGP